MDNNSFQSNKIIFTGAEGFYFNNSINSNLTNNEINSSSYPFLINPSNNLSYYLNYIDNNNVAESLPIYYYNNYTNTLINNLGDFSFLYLSNSNNITINSLNISHYGLMISSVNNSQIKNNSFNVTVYNRQGLEIRSNSESINITNNTFNVNYGNGMYIYSYNSLTSNIQDNIFYVAQGGYGIKLYNSSLLNITRNVFNLSNSANSAIYFDHSNSNSIFSNSITSINGIASYGFNLYFSSYNNFSNNDLSNFSSCLYLYNSSYNYGQNNSLLCKDYGIYLSYGQNNTFSNGSLWLYGSNSKGVYCSRSNYNSLLENSINLTSDSLQSYPSAGINLDTLCHNWIISKNNISTSGNYSYAMLMNSVYDNKQNNMSRNTIRTYGNNNHGLYLIHMLNNSFENNHFFIYGNNSNAIYLYEYTENNTFIDNSIVTSGSYSNGFSFRAGKYNTLRNNTFNISKGNALFFGEIAFTHDPVIYISSLNQNIDTSNTNNGGPIYYLFNNNSANIHDLANVGQLIIVNSSNILVSNVSTYETVWLYVVSNVTLKDSSINNTYYWSIISVYNNASGNKINNNFIYNNTPNVNSNDGAIYFMSSSNLLIQNNTLSHNPVGIYVSSSSSTNPIQFANNSYDNNGIVYYLFRGDGLIFNSEYLFNNTVGLQNSWTSLTNLTFTDCNFINNINDLDVSLESGRFLSFINTTLDKSSILDSGFAVLNFKRYIDVRVKDENNSSLSNVNVDVYNSLGSLEDQSLTDVNGFARMKVREFYRVSGINYYITPSAIKVSKVNYTSNNTIIDLYNQTYAQTNLTLLKIGCGNSFQADLRFGADLQCNDSGIIIGSDNLTINGNGYKLIGNGSGIGLNFNGKKNVTIYNLTISNFTEGVYLESSDGSNFYNLNLSNNSLGIIFNNSNNNAVYDSIIANNLQWNVFAVNDGGTNNSLINTTVDINTINVSGTANIYKKWYVDVNATFNGNYSLPGASVSAYYNGGDLDASALTEDNGNVRIILTEMKKNISGISYLTPHNITLSLLTNLGLIINSTVLNLSQTNNTNVNLSLIINCTVPYSDMYLNQNVTFCPSTFYVNNIYINNENITLNCINTVLSSKNYLTNLGKFTYYEYISNNGIINNKKNNTQIIGCTLKNYQSAISLFDSSNVVVERVNISKYPLNAYSLTFGSSINNLTLRNSVISGLLLGGDNALVYNNTFAETNNGIYISSSNNRIYNNTFLGCNIAVNFGNYFNTYDNNNIYYNNFQSSIHNIYSYRNQTNTNFNTSFNNSAQGNQYDDYCDKGKDLNGDGYADNVSSPTANDWPYSKNITSKIYDPYGVVIDYGPKIITCPAQEVFLGSGGGGGKTTTPVAAAAVVVPQAPTVATKKKVTVPVTPVEEYTQAEDISKNLKQNIQTQKISEQITQVKVTLENTGTKIMKLFPEISQENEDPFFIVTTTTLGFEDSIFSRIAGISYSKDSVTQRLLKANILNPEQIVLNPGEKIERILEISEGLTIPRQIKIQFTTLSGETVFGQEIKSEGKVLSGTAVDIDNSQKTMEVYAIIVPGAEKVFQDPSITGLAVSDLQPSSRNEYYLELSIGKKEVEQTVRKKIPARFKLAEVLYSLFFESKTTFSDLYGPYLIKENKTFVFAQQLKYDPKIYNGDYVVSSRIYRGSSAVVENKFEVKLE